MVGHWGKWSIVREASLPGMPHGRGMCSSINGFSCLKSGVVLCMPPSGSSARSPMHCNCRRSHNWRQRCGRVSGRKGYCPSGPSSLIVCTAIAPIFWRRLMPAWAPRPWSLSPRRRAAGLSGRQRRRRSIGIRAKRHLLPTALAPQSVAALATTLPAWQWYRRTVSEGTKGPIAYDFARHRVTLCKDGLPERTVWLMLKRTCEAEPTYAYTLSNAPASIPFRTLVWLSGIRWAVEQCFEEGKTELGMAHYEVRKYAGWQHHMLLTLLAHFFLWNLKGRLGKKSASTHGVAAALAIPSRVAPAYRYD